MARCLAAIGLALAAAALSGCGSSRARSDACANADGALTNTSFVFVEAPRSGERVSSGFRVSGCSSTFEATVNWQLRARDGRVLASGFTQGGGAEPGSFHFTIAYSVGARQVGELEVAAPRVTTEGFPAVGNVVPLVLNT